VISIIIPARNEALLPWTMDNIAASLEPGQVVDIQVIDDGGAADLSPLSRQARITRFPQSRGNCPARDIGIEQAKYDLCLILDAHMTLPPGWYAKALQWHRPEVIACTGCKGVPDPERGDMGRPDAVASRYYGANLVPWSVGRGGDSRAWQGVWNVDPEHKAAIDQGLIAPTGCLMGGAYFLSRKWYLETLERPWAHLRGWGSSEPVISIAHRRMGGRVEVWPLWFGHVFRASAPYATHLALVWHNMIVASVLAGAGDPVARLLTANPGAAPVIAAAHKLYREGARAYCERMESKWQAQLVEAGQ
jgi:glycosyltransferase involved in cell wall biosynthesis